MCCFFLCFSGRLQQKKIEQKSEYRRGINENRHTQRRYLLYALIETKHNAAILFIGRPTHHIRYDASITHAYTHTYVYKHMHRHTYYTYTYHTHRKKRTQNVSNVFVVRLKKKQTKKRNRENKTKTTATTTTTKPKPTTTEAYKRKSQLTNRIEM